MTGERNVSARDGELFDAEYYRTGFGGPAYERSKHWLEFFSGIAGQIIRSLRPQNVFDAGCGWGFLVESFWDRGIEAWGVDISEYGISHVRPDMVPYCRVASLAEPLDRRYDLITCIEVLEHMLPEEVDLAIANLCQATDQILFSSTPRDFDEPTHRSVRPVMAWLRAFQKQGFVPDVLYDASFFAPHGFLVRRQPEPLPEETLLLFNEKVQLRVELVDKLQRLIQAARDIQELRTRSESAERDRDQYQHRAEELGFTVEEWIANNTELRRRMRHAEDEATLRLQEVTLRLEETLTELDRALWQLNTTREQAAAKEHHLSEDMASLRQQLIALLSRHAEVEQLAQHIDNEYRSPAWQLIKRYRHWMDSARSRHPVIRKVIEPAVVRTLRAVGAAPKPPAPQPALPPEPVVAALAPAVDRALSAPGPQSPVTDPAYLEWIRKNEPNPDDLQILAGVGREFAYRPKISIVTPVYKVPLPVVREAVASVQSQIYDNWEFCIAHADPEGTEVREYLRAAAEADPRIKLELMAENLGISRNSNIALALATGEFIGLLDHDDTLAPFALFEVAKALNDDPAIDFLYSDKDQLVEEGGVEHRVDPLFKPRWSPEVMLSANYLTHFSVMRSEIVHAIGGWRPETDGAQDWDLFLRATSRSRRVHHIPKVLYHWRRIATSVAARGFDAKPYAADAQRLTLQNYCQSQGWDVEARIPDSTGTVHLVWKLRPEEKISIILLPTATPAEAISKAKALLESAGPFSVEIIVPAADEVRGEPGGKAVKSVKVSPDSTAAERLAKAVAHAEGSVLVFADPSLTPGNPEWLRELVGPLENASVGIVGAKLVRPDNEAIRHAGIAFQDGRLQYIFAGQPEHYYEMFGGPGWFRNWTAVSGACMAMRRSVWDQIGGLAGTTSYPRADVELCLRVQFRAGLRVAYNPRARLFQSQTGALEEWQSPDTEAAARFIRATFPDGDPYFNGNLAFQNGSVAFARPPQPPPDQVYSSEARILVTAFDFTRAQLEDSRQICRSAATGKLNRVTWFLPEFSHAFYGGIHTILRFAAHFREQHGVQSAFVIGGQAHPLSLLQRIGAAFPSLADSDVRVLDSESHLNDLPASDAAMATLWTTAYWLLKFRNTHRKYYFIQDYEPLFYPAGSTSALVEATYGFGFTGICNTASLRDIYVAQGGSAEYFDPSIDPAVFYQRSTKNGPSGPFQLFCYARPGHPRNCFELLMESLKRLKQRMGDKVSIVTAGAAFHPSAYRMEGVIRNLGLLGYRETGALYRSCHAGLVAMKTRHPSYLPLELMACGAAVVTNRNPATAWLLRDGENCVLAEISPSALAESLEEVLRSAELRSRLAEAGAACATRYSDWASQAEKIYAFMAAQS
jgi:O-antigen biosynthesis protein